jgi:hypothetical protein
MRILRSIMLAIAATLGASGCAAWNTRTLSPLPRPLTEQTLDVNEFVVAHNRNADKVQSLQAKPSIKVTSKMFGGQAEGRLALERPRNFKLELLTAPMRRVRANIGSNDEEFWVWVDNDDRKVYWCGHDQLASGEIAVTYQPDWIIEALGLKSITPEEARGIKTHDGDIPGTTALIFPARKSGGEFYTKMMIVWNQNRRVKEHRIYEGTAPTARGLLARAEVGGYSVFAAGSADSADGEKVYLPENVKLEWKRDQLALDVSMQHEDVKVNQFDSSLGAAIFVEPTTGHDRVNLAEMARVHRRDPGTRTRETLPAPAARNGMKPGRTTSEPNDTTMVPRARTGTAPRSGSSATNALEDLVTPPLPVGPESAGSPSPVAVSARTDLFQIGR